MTPPADAMSGWVGRMLGGRYVVEALIGQGGFGVVFRARHLVLDVPVAIKALHPQRLSGASRDRFVAATMREAQLLARLRHPAIVAVTDGGHEDDAELGLVPWFAMEWCEGETLDLDLARRRGRGGRPVPDAFALLRPVLEGIAHGHAQGIAHRDIKPGNIVLARSGGAVAARVLDFGLAKKLGEDEDRPITGATRTASADRAYTPAYASPEQLTGGRTGAWTDVHALGLLLTEVLVDRSWHEGDDLPLATIDPVRPTPGKLGVDVGPWESILARAVALHPRERFPDAGELLRALDGALAWSSSWAPSSPQASLAAASSLGVGGVPTAPAGGAATGLASALTAEDPAVVARRAALEAAGTVSARGAGPAAAAAASVPPTRASGAPPGHLSASDAQHGLAPPPTVMSPGGSGPPPAPGGGGSSLPPVVRPGLGLVGNGPAPPTMASPAHGLAVATSATAPAVSISAPPGPVPAAAPARSASPTRALAIVGGIAGLALLGVAAMGGAMLSRDDPPAPVAAAPLAAPGDRAAAPVAPHGAGLRSVTVEGLKRVLAARINITSESTTASGTFDMTHLYVDDGTSFGGVTVYVLKPGLSDQGIIDAAMKSGSVAIAQDANVLLQVGLYGKTTGKPADPEPLLRHILATYPARVLSTGPRTR